ncbi:hypothetical protein T8K17_11270 [Thalassobaculum sp. OXR-137]|uniref:hypothetical protein n=1 Tax=Thalassobaculum sp. OXR-137 TaxID=3100173 RepID=UPI002AC90DD3|nr:hypothetical protein [Thalassobaculum sp. OXR-137]WPZ36715.1 hypothetical protein T8K17_11270 [Thalassobaculum sp. OXR-137]
MPREMYIGGSPSDRVVRRVSDFTGAAGGAVGPQGTWIVSEGDAMLAGTDLGPLATAIDNAPYNHVLSTGVAPASGKYYGEILVIVGTNIVIEVGVTELDTRFGAGVPAGNSGSSALGYNFANGTRRTDLGGSTASPGLGTWPGDEKGVILQVAYDGPGAKLSVGFNGSFGTQDPSAGTGTAFSGFTVSGDVRLCVALYSKYDTAILPATLTYTPPSGFTTWGS